jgi:hypothetical protein
LERVVVLKSGNQVTIPSLVVKAITPDGKELDAFRLTLQTDQTIILEPLFVDKKLK